MEPIGTALSRPITLEQSLSLEGQSLPPEAESTETELMCSARPAPPLTSRVDPDPAGPASPATLSLVNQFSRSNERTHPGVIESSDDHGESAVISHLDKRTGVQVLSASAQAGAQNEIQAAFARASYRAGSAVQIAIGVEAFTARAHAGVHNDDGSVGANLGALATAAGIEATLSYSGWSLTAGLSISEGFAVSSGERNADADEIPERCFRMSLGPATLGFCSEL